MSQNFLNLDSFSLNRNMCSYLKKTQKGKNNRDIVPEFIIITRESIKLET